MGIYIRLSGKEFGYEVGAIVLYFVFAVDDGGCHRFHVAAKATDAPRKLEKTLSRFRTHNASLTTVERPSLYAVSSRRRCSITGYSRSRAARVRASPANVVLSRSSGYEFFTK